MVSGGDLDEVMFAVACRHGLHAEGASLGAKRTRWGEADGSQNGVGHGPISWIVRCARRGRLLLGELSLLLGSWKSGRPTVSEGVGDRGFSEGGRSLSRSFCLVLAPAHERRPPSGGGGGGGVCFFANGMPTKPMLSEPG